MTSLTIERDRPVVSLGDSPPGFDSTRVCALTEADREEVLGFLAERPIHTVCMVGFIRDNGIVSDLNRGTFYGCRNGEGVLEGVALIGHATLVETRTDRALEVLAHQAQRCTRTHMIIGEQERVQDFWNYYAGDGQAMRLACRELLFELEPLREVPEAIDKLRLATRDDLELIVPVHAQMAFDESQINPLDTDPEGFRQRCARRIDRGRTWVLVENGRLIFKAEIFSETPDVIYLEGIYVDDAERGKGYGLRCLYQMCSALLQRTRKICILVNDQNKEAQSFYRKVGFTFKCLYDTIFLQQH